MPHYAGQRDGTIELLSLDPADPELLFTEHDRRQAHAALETSRLFQKPILTLPLFGRLVRLSQEGGSVQAEYFVQELFNLARQQGMDSQEIH